MEQYLWPATSSSSSSSSSSAVTQTHSSLIIHFCLTIKTGSKLTHWRQSPLSTTAFILHVPYDLPENIRSSVSMIDAQCTTVTSCGVFTHAALGLNGMGCAVRCDAVFSCICEYHMYKMADDDYDARYTVSSCILIYTGQWLALAC